MTLVAGADRGGARVPFGGSVGQVPSPRPGVTAFCEKIAGNALTSPLPLCIVPPLGPTTRLNSDGFPYYAN